MEQQKSSWLDRSINLPKPSFELLLIVLILVAAIFTRFYDLGARVMSHDEVNHVVPSYELYSGNGYRHDPVTHGPFQMELVAFTYYLFGDNDFTSRIPAAIFSIAAVAFVIFGYRRYLGRTGALIAGLFFTISPYLMFYGRYTRNEGFIELFLVALLYFVMRYLEDGGMRSLYYFIISLAFYFCIKETVWIFSAQLLLFLAVLLIWELRRSAISSSKKRVSFIIFGLIAIFCFMLFGLAALYIKRELEGGLILTGGLFTVLFAEINVIQLIMVVLFSASMAFLVLSVKALQASIRPEDGLLFRITRLVILSGSLILPTLSAFMIYMTGWNPLDYSSLGMIHTLIYLVITTTTSVWIGVTWGFLSWVKFAGIFYAIFTVLYTTFFTNGAGFFTGIVGGLGYWLSQQGVNRGDQPWFYYAFLQIPIYEFLAAAGTILATIFAIRHKLWWQYPLVAPIAQAEGHEEKKILEAGDQPIKLPIFLILFFWSISSLIAFSFAGEKMPWLTVHITLPMLLSAGWGLGCLVDSTDWSKVLKLKGLLTLLLIPILYFSLSSVIGSLLGPNLPFQGNLLEQLQATNTFLFALLAAGLSVYGIYYFMRDWKIDQTLKWLATVFFIFLAVITLRASIRASFIEYDNPTEYLVYAHAARGPKDILEQVEEISRRVAGDKDIEVAYDNDGLYPYWWYFRDYPNHRWFSEPTRDLSNVPLIIASDVNWGKLESIVRDNYVSFEYMRLWWPNMDYMTLDWERVKNALLDPNWRKALWEIWYNRDYSLYGQLKGTDDVTLSNWQPSQKLRFYIRKDVVSMIWNYGVLPAAQDIIEEDPYVSGMVDLPADQVIFQSGEEPGNLSAPKDLAIARDGSIYVADSKNHRIQHFAIDGTLIDSWGSYANVADSAAPGGTFNEPWGIAVAKDGSVYVADTWNNRIQKFRADGTFVTMWGRSGLAESPDAFYGPRGVAVDDQGRVFVTDTGNKRVVVFDANGNYLTQFGSLGMDPGFFDEPVGIAIGPEGRIYVADTWNQRVQVFESDDAGLAFSVVKTWDVAAWYGQSIENKPFLDVDDAGHVFITDPDGYRVIEFGPDGNFIRGWGAYSSGSDGFGSPSGIAVDDLGRVWVSDSVNNSLLRFPIPAN